MVAVQWDCAVFLPKRSAVVVGVALETTWPFFSFFSKLLYIANVIGQLFILNSVLKTTYNIFGFEFMDNIQTEDGYWVNSPIFPRVTMCDFRVRRLGKFLGNRVYFPVNFLMTNNLMQNASQKSVQKLVLLCSTLKILYTVILKTSSINRHAKIDKQVVSYRLLLKVLCIFCRQCPALQCAMCPAYQYVYRENLHIFVVLDGLRSCCFCDQPSDMAGPIFFDI